MNKLILCEGETAAILLSYYLGKTAGWKYASKAPDGANIQKRKDNESVNWYKKGKDYLLICGVVVGEVIGNSGRIKYEQCMGMEGNKKLF